MPSSGFVVYPVFTSSAMARADTARTFSIPCSNEWWQSGVAAGSAQMSTRSPCWPSFAAVTATEPSSASASTCSRASVRTGCVSPVQARTRPAYVSA